MRKLKKQYKRSYASYLRDQAAAKRKVTVSEDMSWDEIPITGTPDWAAGENSMNPWRKGYRTRTMNGKDPDTKGF